MHGGGGIAILWQHKFVDLSDWKASRFSLMADLKILDACTTGTIANIYGPNAFAQKQDFIHHLRWVDSLAKEGRWIVGGYFNLITVLREKKGGRRVLDKYQDEFRDILAQSSLVDLETGDGWFTWNNRRGGDHLVAYRLDRFLVLEDIMRGSREIWTNVLPAASSDH